MRCEPCCSRALRRPYRRGHDLKPTRRSRDAAGALGGSDLLGRLRAGACSATGSWCGSCWIVSAATSRRRRSWAGSAAATSRRSIGSRSTTRSRSCASPRAPARRTSRGPTCERAERDGRYGVVLIGVAQEKAYAWRGWRDGGNDEHPHFEFGRQAIYVNHYYFYIHDREWGPGVRQDQRVCAVSGLGLPQRPRVGQAPGRPRRASGSARWTTGSRPARTSRALAAICARAQPRRCRGVLCALDARCCRHRSRAAERARYRLPRSRSGSWSCPTPASLIARPPAAPGLSARSPTSSTSGAPTRSRSSSGARSTARPRGAFRRSVITRGVAAGDPGPLQALARSSSTSRTAARCGPRRPSTTRMTSASTAP